MWSFQGIFRQKFSIFSQHWNETYVATSLKMTWSGKSCDTMADNTGHEPISKGNRKDRLDVLKLFLVGRGLCPILKGQEVRIFDGWKLDDRSSRNVGN